MIRKVLAKVSPDDKEGMLIEINFLLILTYLATEDVDLFREYILMYFTNHGGNEFMESFFNILPKCSSVQRKDYLWAIGMLAKKIIRIPNEKIRYYANLAWMHGALPETLETYELTLK